MLETLEKLKVQRQKEQTIKKHFTEKWQASWNTFQESHRNLTAV